MDNNEKQLNPEKPENPARPKPNMQRVGELMQAATRRMNMGERFRFNLSTQDAVDLLTGFYCAEIKARHRQIKLDPKTVDNLVALAEFITDKAPKFGIMFCGPVGNGKTTLMKAFQRCVYYLDDGHHFSFLDNTVYSYRFKPEMIIVDVREIVRTAREDAQRFEYIKKYQMLGIDDLGKEPAEIMDYGNVLSPVIDLLEYRYDKQLFTIITTNLVGKEIREKYGERIADRFNEMLTQVVFKNQTYRL